MRYTLGVLIALVLVVEAAWAGLPTTQIIGDLLTPSGAPLGNCTLTIRPSASFTVNDTSGGNNHRVAMLNQTVNVTAAGSVNLNLVPNVGSGANPTGTYYTIQCKTSNGSTSWMYVTVPTTVSAVRFADVVAR